MFNLENFVILLILLNAETIADFLYYDAMYDLGYPQYTVLMFKLGIFLGLAISLFINLKTILNNKKKTKPFWSGIK